ncbi:MAG: flippase [Ktedonobacterales bacterium]
MNGQQQRVVRNIIALLVNQLGTWTVTFVLTLVVPSYLGLHIFGLYSFVGTFVGFFSLGMNLGTGTYLTWRIAREPQEAGKLTFNTLMLQLPLGIASGILTLTLMPLFDKHPDVMKLALLLLFSTLLSALTSTCVAAMSGLQRMRTPATLNVIGSALGAALIVLCVQLNAGVLSIAAVGVLSQLVTFTATLLYTQVRIKMHPRLNVRLWPKIIAGGMPFFLWSVVLLWYWQIDIPLLKVLAGAHGDEAVGWYAAANKIIGIPVFLPTIVVTALLPALSRERSADSPTFRALASRGIRLVAALNIPAAIGMTMLANSLTSLLHYPPAFDRVAPLIVILSWNMPLVAVDMVLGTILVALGRQKAWTAVGVIAAILNPLVNLWAIPYTQQVWGNGAIAASLTTIMSELIMFAGAIYLCPKNVFTRADVFYIFRCLLAGALMVPAIWGLSLQPHVGVLAAVAYGLVLYAMAAYTLQLVRNDDLAKLWMVVSAKTGLDPSENLRDLLRDAGRPLAFAGSAISRPLSRVGTAVSQPLSRARQRITGAFAHLSLNVPSGLLDQLSGLYASVPDTDNNVTEQQASTHSASMQSGLAIVSDVSHLPDAFPIHDEASDQSNAAYSWPTSDMSPHTVNTSGNGDAEHITSIAEDAEHVREKDTAPSAPPSDDLVTAPLPPRRRAAMASRRSRAAPE